jgi:hypothetical protein
VDGQRVVGVIEQRMAADVTVVGEVDAPPMAASPRRLGAEQLPESARLEVSESSTSLQVSRIQMPPTPMHPCWQTTHIHELSGVFLVGKTSHHPSSSTAVEGDDLGKLYALRRDELAIGVDVARSASGHRQSRVRAQPVCPVAANSPDEVRAPHDVLRPRVGMQGERAEGRL